MVPDALIVHFFEAATKGLDNIVDISNSRHRPPRHLSLADCKRYVLELQKEVLQETLQDYNEKHESAVTIDEAQQALAELNPLEPNSALSVSRTTMEEAARCALCRLVLYTEIHWEADKDDDDDGISRNLQTQGHLDRAKLLDMIALCQTAIKLPEVQQYLADGSPFFLEQPTTDNLTTLPVPNNKEPTIMKFPQARLEKIQRYIAQSIGWDPDFLSRELRRLFVTPDNTPATTNDPNDHWARDPEVTTRFHQLIKEMSLAVSKATLQSSTSGHPLSDVEEGGVTRVISVQCTELPFDTVLNKDHDGHGPMGVSAPGKITIDPHLSEEEQKRQLRLASEATKLQQEILQELMNMTEEQRNQQLWEAEQATEEFLQNTLALPPGMERIAYLQSVDPHTSKLLAIHKLWQTVQQSSNSHNK
jgi:hypothetical protein